MEVSVYYREEQQWVFTKRANQTTRACMFEVPTQSQREEEEER